MDLTIRQSLVHSVAVVGSAYGADREGTMVVRSSMRQPAFLSFPRCAHDRDGFDRGGRDDGDERPNTGALRAGRSAGTTGGLSVSITPPLSARTKPWATHTWATAGRFKPCGKRTARTAGYRLQRGRSA